MQIDVLDDIASGLRIAAQFGTEGSDVDVVGGFAAIAAMNEGVQGGELADHLGDDVIEFFAVRDAIDER